MSLSLPSVSMIDDLLCTSAQPSAEQLSALGETGVRHVINLALPTSDNAVADEGARLAGQGITYVNIPVVWESPASAQFLLFAQVLWAMRDEPVLVHCACNMRASAFVFLYRVVHEGVDLADAAVALHAVWRPEGVWRDFISLQLAGQGLDYDAVAAL
ncbi:MAG TPA: protein tyrosine phosphatase family protein [Moraxellaceae bacterium]|nr:protein tyrosine phosphatase family protein [Moraxellaceae bacterium]